MASPTEVEDVDDALLADEIEGSSSSRPVHTVLKTDDRVLARVTDGIYRQPGSAIRELISNAYDADATRVVIQTDRPRFDVIRVEDDGNGMTPQTVAHLVRHIGGSAKRNEIGTDLGVTDPNDPRLSPGGRRLIGKIGIGLFSVSQLTQSFQIITKTAGANFRTIVTVALKQYSDESDDEDNEYEAGKVVLWTEPATDVDAHGTSVVLTAIRPQTRETLRSNDIWRAIEANDSLEEGAERQDISPPIFHIGRTVGRDENLLRDDAGRLEAVPWDPSKDNGREAFRKLVQAVWDQTERGIPTPKLEQIFDYYLQMAWQLSLAVPLRYYDEDPLNMKFGDKAYLYELPEDFRGSPKAISVGSDSLRSRLELPAETAPPEDFSVLLDDLELARPLRFKDLPTANNAVKKPIVIVAQCREAFEGVPVELSGGPLEFTAYLLWTPKLVPTEHQGVLLRINGASGTVFDPTFLRYQVSEQTRLRQTMCEVLVTRGLDSALNIDRESFNFAHPHVVYITRWLHSALRRLATVQKSIAAGLLESSRQSAESAAVGKIEEIVDTAWGRTRDEDGSEPTPVRFTDDNEADTSDPSEGYHISRKGVFGTARKRGGGSKQRAEARTNEKRIEAIAQVLAAYGLLDQLNATQQAELLSAIRQILETKV